MVVQRTLSGTLNYVTDYTGFSGLVEEQEGNYLALHFPLAEREGVTVTCQLIGSGKDPVTLTDDGIIIIRVVDTSYQLKVVASYDGLESVTKYYAFSGLTLLPSEE